MLITVAHRNLLASSTCNNQFYLAINRDIHVFNPDTLLTTRVLRSVVTETNEDDAINQLYVGEIGLEEVLISVQDDGTVAVRYTRDLSIAPLVFHNHSSTWGVATHSSSRLLAVSANSRRITVWHLASSSRSAPKDYPLGVGIDVRMLEYHNHNIPCIAFSVCGKELYSTSIDGTCRLWRLSSGECLFTYNLNDEYGWYVSALPNSFIQHISPRLADKEPEHAILGDDASISSSQFVESDDEYAIMATTRSITELPLLETILIPTNKNNSVGKSIERINNFIMCTGQSHVYMMGHIDGKLRLLSSFNFNALPNRRLSNTRWFERVNIVVKLDKIGAVFISSQDGRSILARFVRVCHQNAANDYFHIWAEKSIPELDKQPSYPLLGVTALCASEGEYASYKLLLVFYDGTALCYNVSRQGDQLSVEYIL